MIAKRPSRRARVARRKGAAAVELAVCMPFLLALAFGMLEYNNIVMLKTRMVSAAYESARMAVRPTTSETSAPTATAVTTYCRSLLTQLGVNNATVTISPTDLTNIAPQTLVTVTVTAPLGSNSLTTLVLGGVDTPTISATLSVE